MFWKVTCSRLCVSCLSYPNFVVYLNRSIPWACQLYSVQNFAKCDCILIWQHHSDPSLPQSSIPLTNPFPRLPTNPLLTGHPSSGPVRSHPAIHQLKSCNYRAVRPKPLPPPSISPVFRREPVHWLLMADSVAGRPNYVKHRLLLVMSPWQVTGRAGQFSSNNTLNIKLDPMEIIPFFVITFEISALICWE